MSYTRGFDCLIIAVVISCVHKYIHVYDLEFESGASFSIITYIWKMHFMIFIHDAI